MIAALKEGAQIVGGCLVMMAGPILDALGWLRN